MNEAYDRYVSFKGCDWEAKCERIMERLQKHRDEDTSAFWAYFFKQRIQAHRQGLDDLRVLHNYVSTMRDILEMLEDEYTLELLEDLEVTCM